MTDLAESDVDVVHVCSPNHVHLEQTAEVLAAGKHVVCEKPLGTTCDEAAQARDLAAASGRVAAVPFVYRYHPLVRELRARRIAGEFGHLNLIHGTYLQDWLFSANTSNWRVDPQLGGASRAFADIGSHWCDLIEWVTGERITDLAATLSVAIAARTSRHSATFSSAEPAEAFLPVQTEDCASVIFHTDTGTLGNVAISQVAAGRKNRLWFEIDGDRGSAVFDQENAEKVWLGSENGARILFRDPKFGSSEQRRLSHVPAGHAQGYADCYDNFVADVYATIDGESREGLPTFEDGFRAAQIVQAVLNSNSQRAWTTIETPGASAFRPPEIVRPLSSAKA